jgi:hypothetical protein
MISIKTLTSGTTAAPEKAGVKVLASNLFLAENYQ